MIEFPYKKVLGIIGEDRAGKDTVAKYLQETRNFVPYAFADKIKEEFGISKEDFEAAKIAGNIEELRQKLWNFSAAKKEKDTLYFIRKVINDVILAEKSAIITDIRTIDELHAFFDMDNGFHVKRLYLIKTGEEQPDNNGNFQGTKLSYNLLSSLISDNKIRTLNNNNDGLFDFLCRLDKFFFNEDILDLAGFGYDMSGKKDTMLSYLSQFDISKRK